MKLREADVLEDLKTILLIEKEKRKREMLSRERFHGEIIEEKKEISIIKLDKKIEAGKMLGYFEGDSIQPFGYVVASLPEFVVVKRVCNDEAEEFVEAENLSLFDVQIELLDSFEPEILTPFEFQNLNTARMPELDRWQNLAYAAVESMEDGQFLLVVGPPGTGKTKFITVSSKVLGRDKKVLVTAHTNRAVDNVLENLKPGFALRIGYKVSPEVKKHSIEHAIMDFIGNRKEELRVDGIVEKLRDIDRLIKKLLGRARVVGATLMKCALYSMPDFDYVFVDEASQAAISEVLAGIFLGKKVVLVGDPNQLPPVLRCKNPERYSAFNFFSMFTNNAVWLRTHYRSNSEIIGFSARYVYGGNIEPHPSCKLIKLNLKRKAEKYQEVLDPEKPLILLNVGGVEERVGKSWINRREAEVCCKVVKELNRCGVYNVAVITPYLAQKELIREMGVEANTVDAFQGKENDVVIFSTVSTLNLNFSSDKRRFNVAVTRARRKLIVLVNLAAFNRPNNRKTLLYKYYNYAKSKNAIFNDENI